jgi:hypothetical protein
MKSTDSCQGAPSLPAAQLLFLKSPSQTEKFDLWPHFEDFAPAQLVHELRFSFLCRILSSSSITPQSLSTMSSLDQVVKSLDLASDHMWKITLDKPAFDTLKTKCSWLSAQVAVHHALQNTVTHLLGPDGSIPVPQGHLTKFINAAYGSLEDVNHQNRSRLGQIRKLGCVPFLLIASTYTPLDIFKMNRTEFDYLMENVDKYLNFNYPSWRWIFRKEIQMALAAMSGLEHVAPLRKSVLASSKLKIRNADVIRISRAGV